jgi:hypothetical protein
LALVSTQICVQPWDALESPVSRNFFVFTQPTHAAARPALAEPERGVGVLGEIKMMRREAGVDVHPLARLRIVDRNLARRILDRCDLRRRMIRALLAEIRVGRRAERGAEPDAPWPSIIALCRLLAPSQIGLSPQ